MKKKFVLMVAVLLLVIVAGVFAEGTWSSWKSFGGEYQHLYFRMKYDRYNQSAGKHSWILELKNRYNKDVNLSFCLTENKSVQPGDWYRKEIKSGRTERFGEGWAYWLLNLGPDSSVTPVIWIDKVEFR